MTITINSSIPKSRIETGEITLTYLKGLRISMVTASSSYQSAISIGNDCTVGGNLQTGKNVYGMSDVWYSGGGGNLFTDSYGYGKFDAWYTGFLSVHQEACVG